ncbi:ferredoxin family protein [Fusibacter sp. 3D3]|uniref:4Fe-4S dicluster domain-containing protein n=1 Tax=Fusibacter sp. 3D3 TaxID=1048380 RepID=UPI0008557F6B|nr:ferredoxin family protein [Fusibacter sp. 3D3]GAU79787.1 adenylylarge subunitlfate reductase beta-subunit [Fusibacter sp. 3D3]
MKQSKELRRISTLFEFRKVEPAKPIVINDDCIGCLRCVDSCPIDIFMPSSEQGGIPIVAYPDECWYCGACAMECPKNAITLTHPLMNRPKWVAKDTLK